MPVIISVTKPVTKPVTNRVSPVTGTPSYLCLEEEELGWDRSWCSRQEKHCPMAVQAAGGRLQREVRSGQVKHYPRAVQAAAGRLQREVRSGQVRRNTVPGPSRRPPGVCRERSGQVRSGETLSQGRPGGRRASVERSGQVRSGETLSHGRPGGRRASVERGQVRSGQVRSGETLSHDRPGGRRASVERSGQVRSGETLSQGRPGGRRASVERGQVRSGQEKHYPRAVQAAPGVCTERSGQVRSGQVRSGQERQCSAGGNIQGAQKVLAHFCTSRNKRS